MLWAQNARLLCSQNQNGLQNWGIFNRCFGDFTTGVDTGHYLAFEVSLLTY